MPFDRNSQGGLALCLEASHNRARIIHWRDETGKAITTSVQAAAAQHPNIRLMTATTAVDMAMAGEQCVGAHVIVEVKRGLRAVRVRVPNRTKNISVRIEKMTEKNNTFVTWF